MPRYALDSAMPVLLRPEGMVQVGWAPRRAVMVRPPAGLTASALAEVLRSIRVPTDRGEVYQRARYRSRMQSSGIDQTRRDKAGCNEAGCNEAGFDEAGFDEVLAALVAARVVRCESHPAPATPPKTLAIRVHGCGPLTDVLIAGLRCSGARIRQTTRAHITGSALSADLVVLSDYLVTDPRLVRELHTAGVPHLPVRVRDGCGLVGPLVIPGVTSCLWCADLHRADRDVAWPAIAAQLRDVVGHADRPTVLATAAVALAQVHQIMNAVRDTTTAGAPPATIDTTMEVDISSHTIVARRWSRHPRCGCSTPHLPATTLQG